MDCHHRKPARASQKELDYCGVGGDPMCLVLRVLCETLYVCIGRCWEELDIGLYGTTAVWVLLVTTSCLVLISKVMDQFGPNVVYVSYIQRGNIYISLREIPTLKNG